MIRTIEQGFGDAFSHQVHNYRNLFQAQQLRQNQTMASIDKQEIAIRSQGNFHIFLNRIGLPIAVSLDVLINQVIPL
jgi:hypothetical protein